MPVPPRQPVVTFFDPNKRDQGLIEYWNTATADYVPLDVGAPHPNTRDYEGFRLGLQASVQNDDSWVRRVWVTDETSPDWFNYQIKYQAEANSFPSFVRQYREDKKTYAAKTKGAPLDSVIKLVLSTAGTGYTPGTLPTVTFSGGGGTGATGHAIVNLDGTLEDLVIDNQGTGYTSNPTVVIDPPPIGVTATGAAFVQAQTAILIAESAEEFPKDSEFFGLYFNVTRVYETIPGPTLFTKHPDNDGIVVTVAKTRKLAASITPGETLPGGTLWVKTSQEPETSMISMESVESRAIPGNPVPSTSIDDDGQVVSVTTTLKASTAIVTGETLVLGIWTRIIKKEVSDLVSNEVVEVRTIPGPLQPGSQTGKWGKEPTIRQKVEYSTAVIDEGYFVKESIVKAYEGSDLVATKTTVFYDSNLYGVALAGQDYDPRLDTIIPFVQKNQPIDYGIGVNRIDITPEDYQHAIHRTIDPAIVQAVLDAYVFSYPARINVDMPDVLTAIYGVMENDTSQGADQEVGTSDLSGSGSISQTLTAQAQASANILPEAYPVVKQFWGNNIACNHYHFFLANPVTLTDVLTKLNSILFPDTVQDWPKFNPELVTLIIRGGRVSVQAKAHSQGSFATSGTGTASTAAGGTGYSEERGLTVKTLRISPTIHDIIIVNNLAGSDVGATYGTQTVSASAYAECAGLGPLETQTTGPLTVYGTITPSSIPATVGATTWPTYGLYLLRTDPHPYRYGYIEFHCVVVDAADFPNVP